MCSLHYGHIHSLNSYVKWLLYMICFGKISYSTHFTGDAFYACVEVISCLPEVGIIRCSETRAVGQ